MPCPYGQIRNFLGNNVEAGVQLQHASTQGICNLVPKDTLACTDMMSRYPFLCPRDLPQDLGNGAKSLSSKGSMKAPRNTKGSLAVTVYFYRICVRQGGRDDGRIGRSCTFSCLG